MKKDEDKEENKIAAMIGKESFENLQDAIKAAKDGQRIVLNKDYTEGPYGAFSVKSEGYENPAAVKSITCKNSINNGKFSTDISEYFI